MYLFELLIYIYIKYRSVYVLYLRYQMDYEEQRKKIEKSVDLVLHR